jgi:hypothetical protein
MDAAGATNEDCRVGFLGVGPDMNFKKIVSKNQAEHLTG